MAETGSLILPSTGSRPVQILPPVHVVWVCAGRIFSRLEEALLELRPALPAASIPEDRPAHLSRILYS